MTPKSAPLVVGEDSVLSSDQRRNPPLDGFMYGIGTVWSLSQNRLRAHRGHQNMGDGSTLSRNMMLWKSLEA